MSGEHRVAGHLGVAADDYDRTIRTFIPNYERMIATVVRWLDGHVPPGGLVLDLGAGTGGLSAAILDAIPRRARPACRHRSERATLGTIPHWRIVVSLLIRFAPTRSARYGTRRSNSTPFGARLMPILAEMGIGPGEPEAVEVHNVIRRWRPMPLGVVDVRERDHQPVTT
jgi:hypothetical protein